MVEKPFNIKFDFPINNSDVVIGLNAKVELHHSDPYYVVHSFSIPGSKQSPSVSVLPPQEIKYMKGWGRWVHKDSERESLLSIAIGRAIEASGNFKGE
jgi:hypothetical protein